MLLDPSLRLREAVITGNLLIVKRLLRRFPDYLTNIDPTNGWTSLHYAAYHGRYLVCVYLIQLGHDKKEVMKTFKGNNCVHLALMNGHEQTTHLLLQHFPQHIDLPGHQGRTPVHIACLHDYYQCLSLLIGVGASLKIPDDCGETPMHICLEYGSMNCMKMLIFNGGLNDDSVKNKYNWRPSDVAETFDIGKQYARFLKESQNPSLPRRSSYGSFRTPVLPSKPAFEDGPSPVLTMNSPYTLYSPSGTHAQLSKIPTSRPSGVSMTPRSTTGNQSYQSRIASKDSSLTTSSSSINRRDSSNPFVGSNSNLTSKSNLNPSSKGEDLEKRPTNSSLEISPTKKIDDRNKRISNAAYINKYLSGSQDNDTQSLARNQSHKDINDDDNPRSNFNSRRKVSLLNIPVAKLRHDSDE